MPKMVLFQTGNIHFVIAQENVAAVESIPEALRTRLEKGQRQTIRYGGKSYEFIDLSTGLDSGGDHGYPDDAKVMVVSGVPGYALRVDCIEETLSVETRQYDMLPKVFSHAAGACFSRAVKLKNRLALLIDNETLEKLTRVRDSSEATIEEGKHVDAVGASAKGNTTVHSVNSQDKDHTMDAMVDRTLHRFINRRVKRVLSRTMGEIFGR